MYFLYKIVAMGCKVCQNDFQTGGSATHPPDLSFTWSLSSCCSAKDYCSPLLPHSPKSPHTVPHSPKSPHTVLLSPKSPSAFHIISATVNSFSHKALWWGSIPVSQFQSQVFVKETSDYQQEEINYSFTICALSRWRPWCLWKQLNSYTFAEPQSQFRCSVPTWLSAIKLCGGWCTARS